MYSKKVNADFPCFFVSYVNLKVVPKLIICQKFVFSLSFSLYSDLQIISSCTLYSQASQSEVCDLFFPSVLIKYMNCHKCSSSLALDNNNDDRQYRAGKSWTNGSCTSHNSNILGTVVAVAAVVVVIAVAKFPFVFWKWRKMMLLCVEWTNVCRSCLAIPKYWQTC